MESSSSQALALVPDTNIISRDFRWTYGAARGECVGNAESHDGGRFRLARSYWIELQPNVARDSPTGKDTWERDSEGPDAFEAIR